MPAKFKVVTFKLTTLELLAFNARGCRRHSHECDSHDPLSRTLAKWNNGRKIGKKGEGTGKKGRDRKRKGKGLRRKKRWVKGWKCLGYRGRRRRAARKKGAGSE